MTKRVNFLCSWTVIGAEEWRAPPDDEPIVPTRASGVTDAAVTWAPPPIPDDIDPETDAATRAWRDEGLPLIVDPKGIDYSGTVAFLLDHRRPALTTDLDVRFDGVDTFTATGWVDAAYGDALRERGNVSDTVHFRKARIIELTPELRYVLVTESVLVEVSAGFDPARTEQFLIVADAEEVEVFPASQPSGPVASARYDPKATFRWLSEEGEAEYQRLRAEREREYQSYRTAPTRPPTSKPAPPVVQAEAEDRDDPAPTDAEFFVSREFARHAP